MNKINNTITTPIKKEFQQLLFYVATFSTFFFKVTAPIKRYYRKVLYKDTLERNCKRSFSRFLKVKNQFIKYSKHEFQKKKVSAKKKRRFKYIAK
mgnify:CR=1 FL=1